MFIITIYHIDRHILPFVNDSLMAHSGPTVTVNKRQVIFL
jgi:hypothetical protein